MNTDTLQKPLVSICCVTYNHENFIGDCLDGFVKQQTTFPFEILVHEDASTDNTAAIVKEYEKKYPHLFRCVYQTINQFAIQNTLAKILFPMARGKYIALCEGDDYWTDPLKLQKQVDFLEANEDYAICCHEVKILQEDGAEALYNNIEENTSFNINDLVHNNFIAAVSCVFRVYEHHSPLPSWYTGYAGNDYGLKLLNATKGKIYYIKDCMAVYRVHSGGIWSSQSHEEMYENGIKVIDSLNAAFNYQYNKEFEQGKKLRYQRFFPQPDIIAQPVKYSGIKSKIKYYLSKIFSL